MVLAQVAAAGRFGRVLTDRGGRIKRFDEKKAASSSAWINAGIYLLARQLLEQIPVARPLSLERDLFPLWVNDHSVYGFQCSGRFLDIGTPHSYAEAERFFPVPVEA